MADYTGRFRSNYFAVKDAEPFTAFCAEFDLVLISKIEDGKTLYGFLNPRNEAGIPFTRYNVQTESWEAVDFIGRLAEHLLPEYVAVIMEVGSEKMNYLIGEAFAVNAAGQGVTLTLDEIYQRTASLGSICTPCSY